MTPRERFLAACHGHPVDCTPVWLMRQAGRYMAEYRAVRARHTLLEICRTPSLAAEVTITAAETLGVDAAIIFADLLLPCEPLGLKLEFRAGEGPVIAPAVRSPQAIDKLPEIWGGSLDYVGESIAKVERRFSGHLPVIGFCGAPFTLASYLIEGGASRNYIHTKSLMHDEPAAWGALMQKLCAGLGDFVAMQVAAGAAAIQLFDSWAGALGPADYRDHVLPYNRELVARVEALGVPAIYFSTGTAGYLDISAATGARVIGVDWRIDLGRAAAELAAARPGDLPALQGNLDPVLLLASKEALQSAARAVVDAGRTADGGYIFNLGHGILPETPVENVKALVQWVHDWTRS